MFTRPTTMGTTSATTSHPARIVHARQAERRYQMLQLMIATAATVVTATRPRAVAARANVPSLSQLHGPPKAPGTNVRPIRPQATLSAAAVDRGAAGWADDVARDLASTAMKAAISA